MQNAQQQTSPYNYPRQKPTHMISHIGGGVGADGVEVNVIVADPEEVQNFFVDAAGDVVLNVEFGARCAQR